jgi:hypothetical protein
MKERFLSKLKKYWDFKNRDFTNIIYLCGLNDFDLKCYDTTNRLEETLSVFNQIYNKFDGKTFEIVFTKMDVLIEMIKTGHDFGYLKQKGFDKEISLKNIVEFYIQLFTLEMKNNSPYSFYCGNLVDLYDSKVLFKNVMNHIVKNQITEIIYPKIDQFNFFEFNQFFDIVFNL